MKWSQSNIRISLSELHKALDKKDILEYHSQP